MITTNKNCVPAEMCDTILLGIFLCDKRMGRGSLRVRIRVMLMVSITVKVTVICRVGGRVRVRVRIIVSIRLGVHLIKSAMPPSMCM